MNNSNSFSILSYNYILHTQYRLYKASFLQKHLDLFHPLDLI